MALDSCTHQGGWTVQRVAVLRAEVAGIPVYWALQQGLGVLLSLALAALGLLWCRSAKEAPDRPAPSVRARVALWSAGLGLAALAGLLNGLKNATRGPDPDGPAFLIGAVIGSHGALAISLLGFALVWRRR